MAPVTFFTLPTEIRIKLYHLVVEAATIRFSSPSVNKDEWTLVPDERSKYNTLDEGFHHGISYLALADPRASIVFACRKTCIEARNLWMQPIKEIRTFGKYSNVFFDRLCPRRWRPFIQTITSYKVEDERTKFPLRLPNLKNFHVIADVNDIPQPCDLVKATLPGLSDAVHAKVRDILMAMALLGFAIPLRTMRSNLIIAVQSCSNDAKFLEKLYQDCELSCHPTLDSPLGPFPIRIALAVCGSQEFLTSWIA